MRRTDTPSSLLDADADLLAAVPEAEASLARSVLVARTWQVPRGEWRPPEPSALGAGTFAFLVLDGLLTREIVVAAHPSSQLVGPGDVIEPWTGRDPLLPVRIRWVVGEPTTLAVLDDRFVLAGRRWPGLMLHIQQRIAAQEERSAVHAAIGHVNPVELRILGVLWQLADRYGRVAPDGLVVPVRLTHEGLGRLVGAKRPTVTLALQQLHRREALVRRPDGAWLLRRGSEADLATAASGLPPPEAASVAEPVRLRDGAMPGRPESPELARERRRQLLATLGELRTGMEFLRGRLGGLTTRFEGTIASVEVARARARADRDARERTRSGRRGPAG